MRDARARVLVLTLALLAATTLVAGCGSDDDDSSEPSSLALEVSGTKDALELTAPADAEAGPAEITFTNNSDQDLDGQLVFVAEGEDHSDEEVVAELGKAVEGEPVADWFQGAGGPGFAGKGESSTATQNLQAGSYYFVPSTDGPPATPLTKFTVTGESDAELPDADGTVSAVEYSFSADGLKSGEQSLLLDNKGGTWHHFQAFKLKPDATIDQAKAFFEEEGGPPSGPPPFEEDLPIESTVIEGGTSQLVDANLEAGNYAFVCFISDKTGGPPHIAKGMISEVEVTE
jgi:hypothetical protein